MVDVLELSFTYLTKETFCLKHLRTKSWM